MKQSETSLKERRRPLCLGILCTCLTLNVAAILPPSTALNEIKFSWRKMETAMNVRTVKSIWLTFISG